MTFYARLALLFVGVVTVAGCGKESAPPGGTETAPVPAEEAVADAGGGRGVPDFGGVIRVSREVEGVGSTPELATLAALQSAVAQVNGVRVATGLETVRAGLSVSTERQTAAIEGEAFMQQVRAASGGAILGYEVLSQEEIDKVDAEIVSRVRASDEGYSLSAAASESGRAEASARAGDAAARASARYDQSAKLSVDRGPSSFESDVSYRSMRSYWKVRLRADVAQYNGPKEDGRPRIVVALPRVASDSYLVGDDRVASQEVAGAIRARLSDTLTKTQRFVVLDREFGDELQAELDHIASGNVRLEDTARLGQQLATDLILTSVVERFEYPRSSRQLRMSGREVSSYSGGGRITLRLLNVATGEVVLSDRFEHELDATAPSTLPRVVDGKGMAAAMMDSLSERIGSAVVTGIFPISIVAVDGNQAVLSQGGDLLKPGEIYQAVHLGRELRDPQTGRSLGRHEAHCCTIRIDRVAQQTAYGTIEGATLDPSAFVPGSVELRSRLEQPRVSTTVKKSDAPSSGQPAAAGRSARKEAAPTAGAGQEDDPNW